MVGKKALTSLLDKTLEKIQKVDEEFSKQRDFKGIKCLPRQKKKEQKNNLRKTFGKNIFVAIAYNTLTAQKYERSI